ncbi:ABC transporter substrate-binding protein [Planomicrobium sp. CPCC 101079]|uniref:ABC transporter substrate-binding protein n=1 Tax=Planomicrobium sp. CPCC 101079 TaxID=2599618 RepID=UPI0011B62F5E|nr:ABC transporter substrate-binding protein [Planomicrobium sp. CPCC 101079]TWT01597.1 ABC transporter substrate-binding protein [Planomicrobium sp. CPCC 101079]
MKTIKLSWIAFMLTLALALAGCSSASEGEPKASGEEQAVAGGELHVASGQQPETLDPQMSTGSTVKTVARHMYEGLLALDSEFQPQPMLAESWELSEDRKTYTFHLRQGVQFHNGEEMLAEDVVASMNSWLEKSSVASQVVGEEASFVEKDEYTVSLTLKEPKLSTLDTIASPKQFAAIMPKEVFETAGANGVTEYIGTGPFKFVEWKQDQYVHFEKFEEYQALDTPADGLSGKKEALVDDLYFDYVADNTTQLSGIQTGEYDFADSLPYDNYEQLTQDPNVTTYTDLYGNASFHFNKKQGLFTDLKMRQAVNAALSSEEIMLAAWPHEDLYEVDSSYMADSQAWFSEAGADEFNKADPAKVKQLLDEAGYAGEEIVLLAGNDSQLYYAAIVAQEQLKQAGMNVKLDVVDRATYSELRTDPANWDLLSVGLSTVTTPSQHLSISADWFGWAEDEKLHEMLAEIDASETVEEGTAVWNDLQDYLWTDYLPGVKVGDYFSYYASTTKVDGITIFEGPIFWNTTVTQ